MTRNIVLIAMAVLLGACSSAQNYGYSTGDKKAIKYVKAAKECLSVSEKKHDPDYVCAEENYKKALERDPNFIDAWLELGDMYNATRQYEKAADCYEKAIEIDPMYSKTGLLQYYAAKLEMKVGRYEACLKHSKDYLKFPNPNEYLVRDCKRYIVNCEFALTAIKNPVPFDPVNVGPGINTENHEYFPAISGDDSTFLFTREIPDARISEMLGGKQEELLVSEYYNDQWNDAYSISNRVNTVFNEGAPSLSSDNRLLIFTACELLDQRYGDDRNGYGSCDLFFSFKVGNTWSNPRNLGKPISSFQWESQPSFSADGKTLYFVRGIRERSSQRDPQKQDIYFCEYDDKTGWSKPKKLGPNINTPYREESVYIHPDGQTLYFSSNGHPGMGGLDIYLSRKQPDGSWGPAVNLGYPINTSGDENSLLVSSKGQIAYFASTREGGYGGLDIYGFALHEKAQPIFTTFFKGIAYDKSTTEPLGVQFKLVDLATGDTIVASTSDAQTGQFLVSIPANRDYLLHAEKDGYLVFSENFALKDTSRDEPFNFKVPMTPVQLSKNSIVTLKNVFFEFDKSTLLAKSKIELDKLYEQLLKYPDMRIQLRGHTDDQGDDDYNMTLSDQRAKAVMDYLIDKGIDKSRLESKGFGETEPIDTNETPEGRANNRRTEYKIL